MIKSTLKTIIRAYQLTLSPMLKPTIGIGCRFYPTCSDYAFQCLDKYPASIAVARATHRLLRCHPWNDGGVDLP